MTNNQLTDRRISELLESATEYDLTAFAKNDDLALALRELQERRMDAMDGEPIVFTDERNLHYIAMGRETSLIWGKQNHEAGDIPLFRHPQPAPVVQCPFPCGWDSLNKLAIQDAAFVTLALVAGEPATESIRQAAISNNDRLLKVISACRAAMLQAGNSPAHSVLRPEQISGYPAQDGNPPAQSTIDHGYRPECECSGCKATARICAELAGNSPVIPDGYVMVPKEPTAEMVKKMRYHVGGYDRNIKDGYKAMLAATLQKAE